MGGNCFSSIGVVTEEGTVTVTGISGETVVKAGIDELKEAWQSPLREL
jgi:phosphoribosylformylglycinamidine synthase